MFAFVDFRNIWTHSDVSIWHVVTCNLKGFSSTCFYLPHLLYFVITDEDLCLRFIASDTIHVRLKMFNTTSKYTFILHPSFWSSRDVAQLAMVISITPFSWFWICYKHWVSVHQLSIQYECFCQGNGKTLMPILLGKSIGLRS